MDSIKLILRQTFAPTHLEIIDESAKHAGHAESKKHGGAHLNIVVVSTHFSGKSRLERHRLVYELLSQQWPQLHALSLKLWTPEEWVEQKSKTNR